MHQDGQGFNLKRDAKPYDVADEEYPVLDYAAIIQAYFDAQSERSDKQERRR